VRWLTLSTKLYPPPRATAVIVVVLTPSLVAVKPTAGKPLLQLLIAVARLLASVAGVPMPTTKVPAVELVHPLEPLVAAVKTNALLFDPFVIVSVPLGV
jgi:hypothetical protein